MVQSVDRALEILEHLKKAPDGLGITELSNKLGTAKSTVHRLVKTLQKHDYVKTGRTDGIYELGLKFLEMNHTVVENLDIVSLANPILRELTKETSEITHLVMLDDMELVYIDKVEANATTIRIYSQTGKRAPIHCTGVGKAIAAYFSPEEYERYFARTEMKRFTPYTITTKEDFLKETALIRKNGYAMDNEEHEEGIRCVAAPIFEHNGIVRHAISMTGPVSRMSDERLEKIIPMIKEAAMTISRKLGYSS
ncbi:IclR family transcriptional regulator [Alteribacter lacisalsi]|uniref:Glycerol operon regulatory protein n=1 Tax=Alteribacter lacisalsi TaxID=2045244 RepID=A0A2W0HGJ2_9BACI|nr:IclR family transcriptional regulator [Alteribacter lacisalsi]PYZ95919.1 IclR family transcriptional regulator [Alteribacter lacisalsi]